MKYYEPIHNRKELEQFRKKLRSKGTPAEAILWNCLKGSRLEGRKFRRQHSVGSYILDFYCPAEKLCIELDGAHHYTEEGLASDAARTGYLNSLNIRVIRFENREVFERMDQVIEQIKSFFTTPTPPKIGGESLECEETGLK